MTAAIDLLRRTGMQEFQLRWHDDEEPTVWMAVGSWPRPGGTVYEAAGAMRPEVAVFRLCETVMDGGMCTHCKRPSGFSEHVDALPLDTHVCWYQWDPELATFRRGCEGDKS
jgi:hypothetical protein